ncbi:MAG: tetratricopeptide repeat protein [Aliidongia sp.]
MNIQNDTAIRSEQPAARGDGDRQSRLALLTENRPAEALAAFREALLLLPENTSLLYNCGVAAQALGRFEDAIAAYDAALARSPQFAPALINKAAALIQLDRAEEALQACRVALIHQPGNVEAQCNAGQGFMSLGRYREAELIFRDILARVPDRDLVQVNLAHTLLVTRTDGGRLAALRKTARPGHGAASIRSGAVARRDACRPHASRSRRSGFRRYAPVLPLPAAAAAGCQNHRRGAAGACRIAPADGMERRGGGARRKAAAFRSPYPDDEPAGRARHGARDHPGPDALSDRRSGPQRGVAAPARRAAGPQGRARLGGNSQLGQDMFLDRKRSVPLAVLAPLAAVGGVSFVSLQKGAPAAQAAMPPAGLALHDFTAELADFDDTAALVEALDPGHQCRHLGRASGRGPGQAGLGC